jgi:hypothetical protein
MRRSKYFEELQIGATGCSAVTDIDLNIRRLLILDDQMKNQLAQQKDR